MKVKFKKTILVYCAVSTLMILSGGCTSGLTNSNINALKNEAQTTLGCTEDFYFYIVPSQGVINDPFVIGMSAAGPSNLSRHLGKFIALGENESICLAVTGSSTAKTAKSILDALAINEGKQLTTLKFMYIGTVEHKEAIRKAVENLDAKFYFKSIEE